MPHDHGEHGVDEDLVGDDARDQSAAVVLIFLLFPVAPGDGVAGEPRLHVFVDHGCLGGLGDADLPGFVPGVEVDVEGFVAVEVELPGLAGHVV